MSDRHPMFGGQTALPYAGTAGSSGSDASRERAEREAEDGTVEYRQRVTMGYLDEAGPMGLTWFELGEKTGWHHGQSSSTLSTLHKVGTIARLSHGKRGNGSRGRSSVYVAPEYVNGRETVGQGRKSSDSRVNALTEIVKRQELEIARLTLVAQDATHLPESIRVLQDRVDDLTRQRDESRLAHAGDLLALEQAQGSAATLRKEARYLQDRLTILEADVAGLRADLAKANAAATARGDMIVTLRAERTRDREAGIVPYDAQEAALVDYFCKGVESLAGLAPDELFSMKVSTLRSLVSVLGRKRSE